MINKNRTGKIVSNNKRVRMLGSALGLALLLLFIPFSINISLALPSPLPSEIFTSLGITSSQIDIPLIFGPRPVKATQGLTITKSAIPAYPDTVDVGGEIKYQLVVTNNTGGDLAAPMLVSDTVPVYTVCKNAGSSPASWLPDCGSEVEWLLFQGVFSDGVTVILTYTAIVTDVVPYGTVITNNNYLIKQLIGPAVSTGAVVVTTPVNSPQWRINKQISFPPGPIVAPGEELEYTITYSNSGSYPISGLYTVTDTVPQYTTLITSSLPHTNYTGIDAGSIITWTLSTPLNPGGQADVTYRARVSDPLTTGLKIVNSNYGIYGANIIEPAAGNPVTITVQSAVALTISKRLQNPRLGPGDQATYIIDYANNGNAVAANVRITDTLPASVTFISGNPTPVYSDAATSTYAWLIPALPPNAPQTINLDAQIDPAIPDGTLISNTVAMSSPTEGAMLATDVLTSWVFLRPDVVLTMDAADQLFFTPTDAITYTVNYTNAGNITAGTVRITVTLQKVNVQNITPNSATLVSNNGSQLVFEHQGVLASGQSNSIAIDAALIASPWLFTGENFTAQAVATASPEESDTANNAGSVTRAGRPGEPATWLLLPTGDVPANKFFTFYVDDIRDAYGNRIYDGSAVDFSISPIGSVTPESTTTFVGRATTVISSSVTGSAALTIVIAGVKTSTAQLNFLGPDLGIGKVGQPNPAPPGQELVYTIQISNSAGANAGDLTGVVVTDTLLSPNLIYQSAIPSPTAIVGDSYRFDLGTVTGDSPQEIVMTVLVAETAPDFSAVTNTVVAVSNEITNTQPVTEVTDVIIPALEKFVSPAVAQAGEAITYTIVYKNKGALIVNDVRITDTMPAKISGIINIDPGGATIVDNTLPELVFNFSSLAGSTAATITIVGQAAQSPWQPYLVDLLNEVESTTAANPIPETAMVVSQGGPNEPDQISFSLPAQAAVGSQVAINATISDRYGNPVLNGTQAAFSAAPFGTVNPGSDTTGNGAANSSLTANQPGAVVVTVAAGAISSTQQIDFIAASFDIGKTASPNPVAVGNSVSFQIQLTNTAQVEAVDTTVVDTLGAGLTFNTASLPYSVNGNEYTFDLGSVSAGETRRIILTATTDIGLPGGSSVTNTAAVSSLGMAAPITATASVSVFVPTLNKVVTPNPVLAGNLITYTIIYNNFSGVTLNDLQIDDTMPPQVASIVYSDTDGATVVDGTLPDLLFNRANLAAGQATTLTLVGRVITSPWPSTPVDLVNAVTATNSTTPATGTWQALSRGQPNAPYTITLQATITRALVNGSIAISAAVTDQYGNPVVDGTSISFGATSPGQVSPVNALTVNGAAYANVTSNQAATVTVTADDGSNSAAVILEFVDSANPSLTVSKLAQPNPVSANQNLIYTIHVGNSGDIALTNVTVTDTLDAAGLDLAFLQTSPAPAAVSGSTYTFDLGLLNLGALKTIIITAPVKVSAAGTTISNTAQANAAGLPAAESSNTVTTTVKELGQVSAGFRKDAQPDLARAGDNITFTIIYSNENAFPLTNLRITDTLPAQVASIVYSDTGGATVESSPPGMVVFNRDSLAAGAVTTITLVGEMRQSLWGTAWITPTNIANAVNDQDAAPLVALAPFQAGPNVTAKISLQSAPSPGIVDETVVITATLTDRYDNRVLDGTEVTFSAAPPGSLNLPALRLTQNGVATSSLSASQAGLVTVTVSAESVATDTVVTFIAAGYNIYLPVVLK